MKKNTSGRSFVTIMVVIAFTALILRVTIDQVIKLTIAQNETGAQVNLKSLSQALENYSRDNQGVFPDNVSALTKTKPPYLDQDYIARSPIRGYLYACSRIEQNGYSCSAIPVTCALTGESSYTITTGGVFVSEKCGKKE